MTQQRLFMVGKTKTISNICKKQYSMRGVDYIDKLTTTEFREAFIELFRVQGLNKLFGDIKPYHIKILNGTEHCRNSLRDYHTYQNFPICVEKDFPVNIINMLKLKYPTRIHEICIKEKRYYFQLEP